MATNFPGSLDTSSQQPSPSSTTDLDASGYEHDVVHTNHSGAIIALETKLGSTDSNPTANAVLMGTGSGTSEWDTSPTFKGAVTVGVDDTGHDVKFFGATSDSYFLWDESADQLIIRQQSSGNGLDTGLVLQSHQTSDVNLVIGDGIGIDFWIPSDDSPDTFHTATIAASKTSDTDANEGTRLEFQTTENGGSIGTRMVIDDTGNVGIGTTTPMRELDVWSEIMSHDGDDAWLWQTYEDNGLRLWFQSTYTSGDSGWSKKAEFTNTSAPLYLYGLANNQGAYIRFMDSDGDEMCYVGAPNNDDTHLKGNASSGYLYLGNGGTYKFYSTSSSVSGFLPYTDNTFDIGAGGLRFDDVYATNGTIQTSDVNMKKDITNATLGLNFINALRPVEYKWKDGSRKHQGFIAQEVKTVLDAQDAAADQAMWGLNTIKEGTKVIRPITDENGMPQKTEVDNEERQSLRYTELIAPLVKAVQELTTRVAALEG